MLAGSDKIGPITSKETMTMPLQTQMLPEYLSQLPESLPDDGRVLVQNWLRVFEGRRNRL